MPGNGIISESIRSFFWAVMRDNNGAVPNLLNDLILENACYSDGKRIDKVADIKPETEVLIENTLPRKKGKPLTDDDKLFHIYIKHEQSDNVADSENEVHMVYLSGLLDKVEDPTDDVYRKPAEPELHGFAWLRHKLSFLFGEPEAVKAYERGMEVYRAKKMQLVTERYGYDKFQYDPELLDPEKARNYKAGGVKVPQQKKAPEPKQPEVPTVSEEKTTEKDLKKKGQDPVKARKNSRAKAAQDFIKTEYENDMYQRAPWMIVNALKREDEASWTQRNPEYTDKLADYILALKKTDNKDALDDIMEYVEDNQGELYTSALLELVSHADQKGNPFHAGYVAHKRLEGIEVEPVPQQGKGPAPKVPQQGVHLPGGG